MSNIQELQTDLEDAVLRVKAIGGMDAAASISQAILGPANDDKALNRRADGEKAAANHGPAAETRVDDGLGSIIADAHVPDGYEVDVEGLKLIAVAKDGTVTKTLVSSPIWVIARARLWDGGGWCKEVVFRDPDGNIKRHLIPLSALMGQWPSVARRLCDDGLHIEPDSHNFARLRRYLTGALPEKRITLVNCTGWHGESVFVVGAVAIGTTGETVRPAPGVEINELLARGGNFEAWREVMALMSGNSRMLLAVSASFAAPLLRMTGAEQGGFHFHGKSSTGKSTTLYAAGSVWGGGKATGFLRQWSMTKTALEAKLALHDDLPITLDEIHQANPKDIGPMIYAAANGIGKARGRADGSLHQGKEWQTLIISSGERSAVDIIRDAGHTVRAGQEVRLSDIHADADAGYGVFEDIHGFPGAAAFAEHIKSATIANFGWAGPMFVERAIAERDMVIDFVEQTRQTFLTEVVPEGADGQVRRVANRFALAAAAGELATFWGIVPWETHEAAIAAQMCFDNWLDRRGGIGAAEDIRGVEQVLATLDADGMALFAPWNELTTKEQFGWRRQSDDSAWEFLAAAEGFARLIGQRDKKAMEAALVKAGVLAVEADGKHGKVWTVCGKSARLHRLRLV